MRPPILTYLGHVLAHPTQQETAWDRVTTQLYHDIAAYKTLPLNGYEKVAIINAILIPRWAYGGLFLENRYVRVLPLWMHVPRYGRQRGVGQQVTQVCEYGWAHGYCWCCQVIGSKL